MNGYYDQFCPCPLCGHPLRKFDQLRVHRPMRVAIRRGRTAQLTPTELAVLLAMMESHVELTDQTIRTLVHKLRRKLAPLGVEIRNYFVTLMCGYMRPL